MRELRLGEQLMPTPLVTLLLSARFEMLLPGLTGGQMWSREMPKVCKCTPQRKGWRRAWRQESAPGAPPARKTCSAAGRQRRTGRARRQRESRHARGGVSDSSRSTRVKIPINHAAKRPPATAPTTVLVLSVSDAGGSPTLSREAPDRRKHRPLTTPYARGRSGDRSHATRATKRCKPVHSCTFHDQM